jgi:hypothetical protein
MSAYEPENLHKRKYRENGENYAIRSLLNLYLKLCYVFQPLRSTSLIKTAATLIIIIITIAVVDKQVGYMQW